MEYTLLESKLPNIENKELFFSLSKSFSANLRRLNEHKKKDKTLGFILADVLDAFGFTGAAAEMLQLDWESEKNNELKRKALNKSVDLFCKVGEYLEANLICRNNWEKLNDAELRKKAHDLNERTIKEEYEMTKKAREMLKSMHEDTEIKEVHEFLKVGDLFKMEGVYGMARHSYGCAYTRSKVLFERTKIKEAEKEKIKNLMIEACYGEAECYEKMGMLRYALNNLNMYMPECKEKRLGTELEYEKDRLSKKVYLFNTFDFYKIPKKEQGEQEAKQTDQNSQKTEGVKDGEKEIKMGNIIIEKF